MANTPDPRDFYRVSRAVLVPSLWRESLGRVPMEALANGIPVLASDRGALPETLGNAGFVFTIPGRYTAQSLVIPTGEVAPWVSVLEKLWDDPEFEARHRCSGACRGKALGARHSCRTVRAAVPIPWRANCSWGLHA